MVRRAMTRRDMRDRDLMHIAETILGWGDDLRCIEMSDEAATAVKAALEAAYAAGRMHQRRYGGCGD
ncbi:MAG: hypothetical protein J2P54_14190 [Bradyrhizobiaceae bacterium]|nr:hypothetical protein [Bradyrhizobiaceae bacterium]